LKGITREKIIQICNELNYKLIEDFISINNLSSYESAFITGTSPKVLPVASTDEIYFNVNHLLLRNIMSRYDSMIEEYIRNIRKAGYFKLN